MRRINYLCSWSERTTGIALPATTAQLRTPLLALACSFLLVLVLWSVQHARIRSAQHAGAGYARRLALLEAPLSRARAAEREVEALRARIAHRRALRASGAEAANAIATLGNRLPDGAWLSTLRAEERGIELEGRGARIDTVGAAVAQLATLPEYAATRLLSAREEPARGGVTYAISMERAR